MDQTTMVTHKVNNSDVQPVCDAQPHPDAKYVSVEQIERKNHPIHVSAEQVTELQRAQIQSNETANALVGRLSRLLEAMGSSTKKLHVDSQKQAEQTQQQEQCLNQVYNSQQQWWDQQNGLQTSHQRHQNELWGHYQQLNDLAQWRDGINQDMHDGPSSSTMEGE